MKEILERHGSRRTTARCVGMRYCAGHPLLLRRKKVKRKGEDAQRGACGEVPTN